MTFIALGLGGDSRALGPPRVNLSILPQPDQGLADIGGIGNVGVASPRVPDTQTTMQDFFSFICHGQDQIQDISRVKVALSREHAPPSPHSRRTNSPKTTCQ